MVLNLDRFQPALKPGGKIPSWDVPASWPHSLDYAVAMGAFVLDHQPHCHGHTGGPGNTQSNCSAQPPHGSFGADDEMILEVFSQLDPLFSAYGWADSEHAWTNITSVSGGTVFCTGPAPNLSFWARLACDLAGRREAQRLPVHDRGLKYDANSTYVTFMTNEARLPPFLPGRPSTESALCLRGTHPGFSPASSKERGLTLPVARSRSRGRSTRSSPSISRRSLTFSRSRPQATTPSSRGSQGLATSS